jgi:perosamine synthetase
MSFIPINRPILGDEEKAAVADVLASGGLTNASYEGGKYVRAFESKVSSLLGAKHVVAVNSGTAALHSVLMALGVKPGDEVIVPSFTFVATSNVVLASGARPVFVDTKTDYNMDPKEFKKAITKKTKAVIPVHVFGYAADMDEIREIAAAKSIPIIEDAAESMGATYRGTQTGRLSLAGCFSMYASKVVTSGEGGAISTDDDDLADTLRLVRNHGMVRHNDSRHLGFNYRLPEMGAALASVQMDRLPGFLDARARNARFLTEKVASIDGASFTQQGSDRSHVYYLYTLYLRKNRDRILKALNGAKIGAAVYFQIPAHKTELYSRLGYGRKVLKNTEAASKHVLSLPVHPAVTEADIERVATEFLKAAHEHL